MLNLNAAPNFSHAPRMGTAFGDSAPFTGRGDGAYFIPFSAQDESESGLAGQFSDQSRLDYSPGAQCTLQRKIGLIEDMIDTNDYRGAAEEILRISPDDVSPALFDRFKDAMSEASYGLSGKNTYLNAQLASQAIAINAVEQERKSVKQLAAPTRELDLV